MAPTVLAMAAPKDTPLDALLLVRDVLDAYDGAGYEAGLDNALSIVVVRLVRLGHHRPAAFLLGGRSALPTSIPEGRQVLPRATTALADALGEDFESLLEERRRLTRDQLVRLALDEIEICIKTILADTDAVRVGPALPELGARRRPQRSDRPTFGWSALTPMETEVSQLVAQGLTNPEIAARLFISRRTVETHLSHVFRKLGLPSRTHLIAELTRRGYAS